MARHSTHRQNPKIPNSAMRLAARNMSCSVRRSLSCMMGFPSSPAHTRQYSCICSTVTRVYYCTHRAAFSELFFGWRCFESKKIYREKVTALAAHPAGICKGEMSQIKKGTLARSSGIYPAPPDYMPQGSLCRAQQQQKQATKTKEPY